MELPIRMCLVILGTFLSFCLLLYDCKKLDGYNKFPVYSTEFCPRNQTEWNERSSAINCTEDNGYLCFPNEKFTQLLEFCHTARFIWIEEDYCLYLDKGDSSLYSYSCTGFQTGCHNSSFPSYQLFEHPGCTSIGNGCFLAEPSCEVSSTPTDHPVTKQKKHYLIRYHTTKHNNKWVLIVTSTGGVIFICLFVVVVICEREKLCISKPAFPYQFYPLKRVRR